MSAQAINDMLWEKHAPEIDRACTENFEDKSMLTDYHAAKYAKKLDEELAVSTPLFSPNTRCSCHGQCICRLRCDEDVNGCTCKNQRVQIYQQVYEQETDKAKVYEKIPSQQASQDYTPRTKFLGAPTNSLAQLQVAALAEPNLVNAVACNEAAAIVTYQREKEAAARGRARTNTNNSELAYVPNRTPKDAFPLDFYKNESPQRYPKITCQLVSRCQPRSYLLPTHTGMTLPPFSLAMAVKNLMELSRRHRAARHRCRHFIRLVKPRIQQSLSRRATAWSHKAFQCQHLATHGEREPTTPTLRSSTSNTCTPTTSNQRTTMLACYPVIHPPSNTVSSKPSSHSRVSHVQGSPVHHSTPKLPTTSQP